MKSVKESSKRGKETDSQLQMQHHFCPCRGSLRKASRDTVYVVLARPSREKRARAFTRLPSAPDTTQLDLVYDRRHHPKHEIAAGA